MADYLLVALIGMVAATAELVTRFKDEPGRIWRTYAAFLYLLFNGAVGCLALLLIRATGTTAGPDAALSQRVWQVLAAGAGGLAVFRSNFSLVRIGDKELALNFGLIISGLLESLDRQIDRSRSEDRLLIVEEVMGKVDFDKALQSLPLLCLQSMQAVTEQETQVLAEQILELEKSDIKGKSRSLALGMLLLNVVGETTLRKACESLRSEIE